MFVAGCAATAPHVVVAPVVGRDVLNTHPLDVRFAEVHIDNIEIFRAIDRLGEHVHRVYGDRFAFTWSYSPGAFDATGNYRVTFHGRNVTTRAIFDEFARQTGMAYRYGPHGFVWSNALPPGSRHYQIRRAKKGLTRRRS